MGSFMQLDSSKVASMAKKISSECFSMRLLPDLTIIYRAQIEMNNKIITEMQYTDQ